MSADRSPPPPSVSVTSWARGAEVRCSFCLRGLRANASPRRIVAGPGEWPHQVFICDECVALCAELLAEEGDE
jgi:ClpX C4-type zinc finger